MLLANQTAGFFKMQYLKEEVNDEVYFWHTEKHRTFLQVDLIILGVRSQACLKYLKQEVFISLQYIQKNMGDQVLSLSVDKYEIFLQGVV